MATFRNEPEEWQRLDWMILQNGWVSLYARPEFLLIDTAWFRKERYRVIELDCSKWVDDEAMYTDLKLRFRLPNNDASDMKALKAGLADTTILGAGLVIVLHQLDTLAKDKGQTLLQAFAESARFKMLLGERIITLAQVNDANISYDPVGALPVTWNPHEWLP